MPPDIAQRFTMPGYTREKKIGHTIGYKGVGASFFFAASNNVAFLTEDTTGKQTAGTVKGSYRWIMSTNEPAPIVTSEFLCPNNARHLLPSGHGTAIYYEFHSGLKPKSLSHIVLVDDNPVLELRRWASYLCSKTALGQAASDETVPMQVWLHLDRGEELHSTEWSLGAFDLEERQLGYPYPWRVLKVHEDVTNIDNTADSQRLIRHKGKHQALRLRWSREELLESKNLRLSDDERELAMEHLEFLDVFFAYSTKILETIHRRTGSRSNVLRYGIRMVWDGIPQGRIADFDLTRHQGLARQAHAVVGFRGLELDTGRKIPANDVVTEVVRKITVRAMNHLTDYRWALKTKSRPDPSPNLDGWRNDTKERMSLSIVRSLFEILDHKAAILVDPDTEQDVIALFAALLARRVLRGYEMVALSGFNQYDGLVHILTDADYLKRDTDTFSVRNYDEPRGGDYKVLEFKLQFESLLDDFESKRKRPQDIDLLVCWTLPDINVRRGRLSYTYGERNEFRQTYGMTHLWVDENETSSIPILCLKHFVTEKLKRAEMERGVAGTGTASFRKLEAQEKTASI